MRAIAIDPVPEIRVNAVRRRPALVMQVDMELVLKIRLKGTYILGAEVDVIRAVMLEHEFAAVPHLPPVSCRAAIEVRKPVLRQP